MLQMQQSASLWEIFSLIPDEYVSEAPLTNSVYFSSEYVFLSVDADKWHADMTSLESFLYYILHDCLAKNRGNDKHY
jgi:hypothetical protein